MCLKCELLTFEISAKTRETVGRTGAHVPIVGIVNDAFADSWKYSAFNVG